MKTCKRCGEKTKAPLYQLITPDGWATVCEACAMVLHDDDQVFDVERALDRWSNPDERGEIVVWLANGSPRWVSLKFAEALLVWHGSKAMLTFVRMMETHEEAKK